MPIATSYTEDELKAYMHSVLGSSITDVFSFSVAGGSYNEAVNETLYQMEVDTIASISGREAVRKLRVVARMELWRAVAAYTSDHAVAVNVPNGSYSGKSIHERAMAEFDKAKAEAESLGVGVTASKPAMIKVIR